VLARAAIDPAAALTSPPGGSPFGPAHVPSSPLQSLGARADHAISSHGAPIAGAVEQAAAHARGGIRNEADALYDEMRRLLRDEQEQIGQLIQHPF
jgi:hypothetical protein